MKGIFHKYLEDGTLRISWTRICVWSKSFHLFAQVDYQNEIPVRTFMCTDCMGPSAGYREGVNLSDHVPGGIQDYFDRLNQQK